MFGGLSFKKGFKPDGGRLEDSGFNASVYIYGAPVGEEDTL